MRNKIIITLVLVSVFAFVPAVSNANAAVNPQIRVQIGKTHHHHDRGRHYGWYQGRRSYYYNYNPGTARYVRRSYYNNGVRTYRWYYNN